ncbi:uncharacterized protein LOC112570068 isoform X2 [Pomacea canaliculata]|uniref:uncharacterized protein LOC112570068 isoform X2 n=1 Tax=Pomacea canaliculata TaxID=400727 RepID=UPI000D729AF1|nr:uncharacterized protein LOC112570068 isoform X2 [Pomacea canaliculata]
MAVTWRGPVQLYGPDRTQRRQALELQARLQQSHVLRDDDYNLTHHHLRDAAWHIAFPGQKLDRSVPTFSMRQHDHHFKLGNDSGDFVPPSAYRESVTRGDFDMKPTTKTKVINADTTIHWPVIAPRDNPARQSGSSEYTSTFSVLQNRERSAPTFPKVNTFKMALPLDPTRFHVQRGSQLQLGCEQQSSDVSEIKRAYGKVTSAEYTTHTLADGDARRKFKEQELASSIFRPGDFNDTAGGMHTTSMIDYAPRTTPQGEILGSQRGQVQTRAHFQLGFDSEQNGSMYDKDYELSAMATRSVPKLHPPPDAGHVLQKDDEYRNLPKTSHRHHFMKPTPLEQSGISKNRLRNSNDSIVLSCDTSRHAQDRQLSLSHSDYQRPPTSYQPSLRSNHLKLLFLSCIPKYHCHTPRLLEKAKQQTTTRVSLLEEFTPWTVAAVAMTCVASAPWTPRQLTM